MSENWKHAFLILAILGGWIATATAENPVIRRTTLLVSDAEKSQAFYEFLGFSEWLDWSGDQDPNEPTALPLTGQPNDSRIIIMAGEDTYNGMIGLLEFDSPPLADNRVNSDRMGVRDIILMIETDDIRPIHEKLIAEGHEILRPPGAYESDGPAGAKRGMNMLVRDPDGYVVEVTDVQNDD